MKISDFSIKRPVFTIVIMMLVIILGGVSFFKIPITLIPDLNPPIAVVVTNYAGASPVEVDEKITKPLEASLSTLPGIKSINSTSQEGANFILLEFDWAMDMDDVQLDVIQRIEVIPIPDGASKPQYLKFDPAQFPVIQLSLRAADGDTNIRLIAEELEKELISTEGVANVNISGSLVEEVQILLDQQKLVEKGLTQSDIVQLIQVNNISLPGNPIETDDNKSLTTRIISTLTSVSDIENLVLTVNPLTGKAVTIADVGKVELVEQDQSSETRANEEPAVLLSVFQESSANTADVSTAFQESLDQVLEKEEYKGVTANILFDQGDYVKLAISNIGTTLITGGLLAMVVLFVFLKGIRSPIIVGVAIPYSVIVTFVLMYFAGFSLNIMTLGALALGIGMLVDNSIVVIENIERHLGLGKNPKEATYIGTKEVIGAITASTLTTIAVFVPVIFLSGLIGQIFTEFALTISFSLLASLLVAITVIPMMASRLLKKPKGDMEAKRRRSKAYNNFEKSVKWSLNHRAIILSITAFLLVISTLGLFRVGTEFLPATDEGFVTIAVRLENGSSFTATDEVVKRIEKELQKEKDIEVYVSFVGGNQEGQSRGTSRSNIAEIYVKLVELEDRDRSIFTFVDEIQPKVVKTVGENVEVNFNMQSASGSTPNTVSFTMFSTDKEELNKSVSELQGKLEKLTGVVKVNTDLSATVEEIQMSVKKEAAIDFGLTPAQIAQTVNNATRGVFATQIISEEDNVYGVNVKYDEVSRQNIEQLKQLKLRTPYGQYIDLQDVATIEVKEGPVAIRSVDQAHAVALTVKYGADYSLGDMSDKVDEIIEQVNLPENVFVTFGGDTELLENAKSDMILAVLLAVVLVYIVMAAQFESFKFPFVIMFTVPLIVIGIFIGLFTTSSPISISAVIGILILVGIVVNNGIVLVDYINKRKTDGMSSYDAITTSVRDRVRPILMTALTTILGLVPLALGIGEGTEINQPMAITVIGGLISSTFFTLFVVPVIYSLFDKGIKGNLTSENSEK
ncbi:HAE1 family hydrophobic/amphiphilic exporter-1 [Psychrobacillus insolitus]|uniref:HAE1 family hydrophobic/amphiphilic exporter-1 n=1 Tax=Psychrobacillus insolitus TaxID=1461 RepID=A0A2W7MLB1_9BACI|nr:efflux RND transporter permease subunit [Psychrobacillus insolitus]PZX08152.1 HAE1 family hydrophobic/amphiphilic exporter-1 [Psychrobacillus insolitus]